MDKQDNLVSQEKASRKDGGSSKVLRRLPVAPYLGENLELPDARYGSVSIFSNQAKLGHQTHHLLSPVVSGVTQGFTPSIPMMS